jgi:hypothetical protein
LRYHTDAIVVIMTLKYSILAFLGGLSLALGQIGGQSVYQFLTLPSAPRQSAMGGKVVSIMDFDPQFAVYNPAVINAEMHNRVALAYTNLFGEVSFGSAAYGYSLDKSDHTFVAGVQYINYGTFDGRDENGDFTTNFSGSEVALSVGYAHIFTDPRYRVGANVRAITSTLERYQSFGGAVDFGFLYESLDQNTILTLVLRNLGTQFTTYAGLRESLPTELILSISRELENLPLRWHITLDQLQQWDLSYANPNRGSTTLDGVEEPERVSALNNALRHFSLGGEFFPGKAINLRFGYNFRRGEELKIVEQRNFSGLSLGFGIRFNNFRFDYSFARYSTAGNTSQFGMMLQLK